MAYVRQHSLERGRELQSGVVLKLPKAIIPAVYQVALLFILFVSSLPSIAANTESQTFSIREATIATALRKFAKQAQISVNYPRLSYRDGKTQLLGDYSVSEGLDKLLSGSRFTYKKVGQNSYVIVKKVKPHPKPADAVSANSIPLPTITEITVTALKRSDELQKLPYSISAISNSSIQDQRLLGFAELSTQLSGVVFTQQGLGQNKILVRGLSDGIFSGSSQSLINTYLNGNRLTYSSGVPDIKLVDIEQIELLKGPQGTLYGSGAIAGLLNIVPRKPLFNSFELELTTSLSYTQHGDASNDVSAIINLPILKDKLAIRNALYIGDFGGYIDDIRLGMSDVNRARVTTSRFAASYQLSSDWSMTGGVNYQAENRSDSDYYRVNLPRYSRDNHSKEPRRTTFQQYYLNVEAELSGLKLDANTSILTRIIDSEIDASRLLTEDISRFFDSVEEQMINQNLRLTEIIKQSTFTHELHLKNLSGSKTEWILGAFFSRTEDEYQSELYFPEGEPGMAIPLPDRINTTDRTQMVEELAAFGELTYHVNSSFSLAGGLRWFRSTNQARETFVDNISASFTHVSLGNNTQSGLLGKFVASYHRNNSVSYFQVSQGYRIGGPNLQTPDFFIEDGERIFAEEEFAAPFTSEGSFLDEKLTNYEIGHKVELIDQSLAINGAVFLAEWTNIQAFEFFFISGFPLQTNLSDADIIGGEVEVSYQPSPGLLLKGHISVSDAKLRPDEDLLHDSALATLGAAEADPLPGVPSLSAAASIHYEFSAVFDSRASFNANYFFSKGSSFLFDNQSPLQIEDHSITNVNLSFHKNNWRVRFFANNLFNSDANIFPYGNRFRIRNLFGENAQYITSYRPRTIGLEVGWQF